MSTVEGEMFKPDLLGTIPENCLECIAARLKAVEIAGKIACTYPEQMAVAKEQFGEFLGSCAIGPELVGTEFCSTQKKMCRHPQSESAVVGWQPEL